MKERQSDTKGSSGRFSCTRGPKNRIRLDNPPSGLDPPLPFIRYYSGHGPYAGGVIDGTNQTKGNMYRNPYEVRGKTLQ